MKKFISDYLIPTYTEVFKIIMAICLFLFACIIIALVIFTALNWCILKIGVTWGVILGVISIIILLIIIISVVRYIQDK